MKFLRWKTLKAKVAQVHPIKLMKKMSENEIEGFCYIEKLINLLKIQLIWSITSIFSGLG